MGSLGWHNPLPLELGGGPTEDEVLYEALKRAVGEGNYAKDESGIDGLDRAIEAGMLATVAGFAERAALQAFPQTMTDHIPLAEDYLGITPSGTATDEQRRQEILARTTRDIQAAEPDVAAQLALIDPRASPVATVHERTTVTVLGKAFEPQDAAPTYGPRKSTGYPNFSTEFYVPVLLDIGGSLVPTPADQLSIARIKRMLNDVLPSWVDYSVVTSLGFILDLSPLDYTAMT